ncbi:metal-dependent hydrolase family protein [Sphingobium vermicomposti]|uniref:Imidazolonepropionase-like amidohydrolase n=1 Tax=Sphingobium vermicomposti TaxID=529005 RepID=A0A846M5A6_9SPHN|nr:amidohydrolase family protein [Sphingobium vermicomposti]NIJ15920.1 imidazolonepropionase-like amidohydrolase [Sphingobium vermicomposti]
MIRFSFCMAAAVALFAAPASAQQVAIQAGHLFDATDGRMRGPTTIFVSGERIERVEDGFVERPGYRIVDQRQRTVLPGLIDCHVHLTMSDNSYKIAASTPDRSTAALALLAPRNAQATLEAGFTSVRNVGAYGGTDLLLKQAIDAGDLPGPRMFVALEAIGPTGGHSDPANHNDAALDSPERRNAVADGVDAFVQLVRDHKRRGATLIKIMPGGGVGSPGDDPNRQLMTDAEIVAVVETAHSLGMRVAAHAEGEGAIDAALRGGVDSIEHGDFASARSWTMAKAKGIALVPTLATSEALMIAFREHPDRYPAEIREKISMVTPYSIKALGAAYRAHVRIAFGTDATGLVPHGGNAMEFPLMVKAGMSASDAILAATANAADLIGSPDIGRLVPGRYADMIAVDGDPLHDISILSNVAWVMKGGAEVAGR